MSHHDTLTERAINPADLQAAVELDDLSHLLGAAQGLHPHDRLTPRELDVLRLIARGFRNKQIAEKLCISDKTIQRHVSNILAKLDTSNRTQAAVVYLTRFAKEM